MERSTSTRGLPGSFRPTDSRMAPPENPPGLLVVDGTTRDCAGVLAALEMTMRELPEGATIVAIVADVPSRIDVHAWAHRKGHSVTSDRAEEGRYRLRIVKGRRTAPASGS